MSVSRQLYQLQEIDLEIEGAERVISQVRGQLGESEALLGARHKVATGRERLEELRKQQRTLEWEVDDLAGKLKAAEEKLYGGQVRNPKELTALQQEVALLKSHRGQLEDRVLDMIEQAEQVNATLASAEKELKAIDEEWRKQQQALTADLERLNAALVDLRQKREQQSAGLDSRIAAAYQELRRQKGTAVARVEQGICRGCRISLPVSELQKARSGELVRCGSCGRILYLA